MTDDTQKPERWDLPDYAQGRTWDWDRLLRQREELVEQHRKGTLSSDIGISTVATIEHGIQWSAFFVFVLMRAMLSAQTRISTLESELAAATGRPPPPAPEPQDDRLLKIIEHITAGATRGGLKALMPNLPD